MTKRSRTIEWSDPLLNVSAAEGRTGLEILRALADGSVTQPPISALMDFKLTEASEGFTRCEGLPGESVCNVMGWVHGGYACTMLDSAMSCAVMTTLDAVTAYTTAQVAVHMTRTITIDTGPIIAEGRVVHRGKRLATAEGTLKDRAGNLLAHGTTTCMLFERPAGKAR
jgi:uncharacterized protein (TIGR00369 family)